LSTDLSHFSFRLFIYIAFSVIISGCVHHKKTEVLNTGADTAFKLKIPNKIVSGTAYIKISEKKILLEARNAVNKAIATVRITPDELVIYFLKRNCQYTIRGWLKKLPMITGQTVDFEFVKKILSSDPTQQSILTFQFQHRDKVPVKITRKPASPDYAGEVVINVNNSLYQLKIKWLEEMHRDNNSIEGSGNYDNFQPCKNIQL